MSQYGDQIIVTHYVNPQSFWYCKFSDLEACAAELHQIQSHLKSQYKSKVIAAQYRRPQLYKNNAKIMLEYLPLHKYLRAEVLQVLNEPDEIYRRRRYIVWAMDFGFPIETLDIHMKPLPLELSQSLLHIQRGGISYLLPTSEDDMAQRVNWSNHACDSFYTKLKTAECLSFDISFQTRVGQNFGNLYLTEGQNTITAAEYLIGNGFARVCEYGFKEFCEELLSTSLCRWLTNDSKPHGETNRKHVLELASFRAINDYIDAITSAKTQTNVSVSPKTPESTCESTRFETSIDNGMKKDEPMTSPKITPTTNQYNRFRRKIDNLHNPAEFHQRVDLIVKRYDRSEPFPEFKLSTAVSNSSALKSAEKSKKPHTKAAQIDQRQMFKLDILMHKMTSVSEPTSAINATDSSETASTSSSCTNNSLKQSKSPPKPVELQNVGNNEDTESKHDKLTFEQYIQQHQQRKQKSNESNQSKSPNAIGPRSANNDGQQLINSPGLTDNKISFEQKQEKSVAPSTTAKQSTKSEGSSSGNDDGYQVVNSQLKAVQQMPANNVQLELNQNKLTFGQVPKCLINSSSDISSLRSAKKTRQRLAKNSDHTELTGPKMTFDQYIQQQQKMYAASTTSSKSEKSVGTSSTSSCGSLHSIRSSINSLAQVFANNAEPVKQKVHTENVKSVSSSSSSLNSYKSLSSQESTKTSQTVFMMAPEMLDIAIRSQTEQTLQGNVQTRQTLTRNPEQSTLNEQPQFVAAESAQNNGTIFCDHALLAHSAVPLQKLLFGYSEYFAQPVCSVMQQKQMDQMFGTQMYAWPHLMHDGGRHSLVIINTAKTGRTWSYLPALCSLVYNSMYLSLQKFKAASGPMAIVLVANSRQAHFLTQTCKSLMQNKYFKSSPVVGAYEGGQKNSHVRVALHNGCGILVATPTQLLQLLQQNVQEQMFDAARLAHIVIDDIDLIHALDAAACKSLLVQLLKLSERRRGELAAQLIVTSQYWDAGYMSWFVQHAHAPLLLFGDFLEAAAYARVQLHVKIAARREKFQHLLCFLAKRGSNARTIIFCKDEKEIFTLTKMLQAAGYNCLAYLQSVDADVQQRVDAWQQVHNDLLLICLDNVQKLRIQNAQFLVNFTLVNSWLKFKKRFSTIAQNFANMLPVNGNVTKLPTASTPQVLVLLDEENDIELPHLVKFLTKHNQKLEPEILAVARHCQRKQEEVRISRGYAICPELACFGDCHTAESNCRYRHVLTAQDAVQEQQRADIPCFGAIVVQILQVYTPTHFAVRLLKHRAEDTENWRTLSQQTRYTRLAFKLNMHFAQDANRQRHSPPRVRDICVLKVGEQYQRVRILEATSTDLYVKVMSLDVNTDVLCRRATEVLVCPEQFQAIPPLAIDIRLAGVLPLHGERSWLSSAKALVEKELQRASDAKGEQILCIVDFSLTHTIFIKNLIVLEHLPTLRTQTYKINFKQWLVDNKLGKIEKGVVQELHNWVSDIIQVEQQQQEKRALGSETPSTCDDNEQINTSQDENDSANQSVTAALEQLELADNVRATNPTPTINAIAMHKNDTNAAEPAISAKHTETWCTLPLNTLVKIEIGHAKENGLWSDFHILNMSEDHILAFDDLQQRIANYMRKVQPACIKELLPNMIGDCFILRYDDEFVRAKLLPFNESGAPNFFRLLLVDHGYVVNLKGRIFNKEILYPITGELIDALPFQTMGCKLAGVNLHPTAIHVKTNAVHLYAVAKRECQPELLKSTQMRGYEILLFESDAREALQHASMLNKRLIELGVAAEDVQTSDDLNACITDYMPEQAEQLYDGFEQLKESIKTILNYDESEQEHAKLFIQELFGFDALTAANKTSTKTAKVKSLEDTSKTCNAQSTMQTLPKALPTLTPLGSKSRRPQVCWHQNLSFIQFKVVAQEQTKYLVSFDGTRLFYSTIDCESVEDFLLHLCGHVQKVWHEKRGLNVVIKLLKSNCGYWPSLLKPLAGSDNEKVFKLNWLKYNLEYAKPATQELSDAQRALLMQSRLDAGLNYTNDENWSDDSDYSDTENDYVHSKSGYKNLNDDFEEHSHEFPVC